MTRTAQPISIWELTVAEKRQLLKILQQAKQHRVCSQRSLEEMWQSEIATGDSNDPQTMKSPLRYFFSQDAGIKLASTDKKSDVVYGKWVFLYNYVIDILWEKCKANNFFHVSAEIEHLYALGLTSGRYDNDISIINQEYLSPDTNVPLEPRYHGTFVGFRIDSTGVRVLLNVLKIEPGKSRDFFSTRMLSEGFDRHTKGVAYQLGQQLYLSGFLERRHGFESYALLSDHPRGDILFGIMATIDRHERPHAKQCCFVRAAALKGVRALHDVDDIEALRTLSQEFYDGKTTIALEQSAVPLDLRRYVARREAAWAINDNKYLYGEQRW